MADLHRVTTPILVVGPAWVGDMVMAQSLFKVLKQRYPQRAIDVLAPAWSRPLLQRMPEVRESIAMPLGHGQLGLSQRWRLGRTLKEQGYGWAIVLPRALKAALVPFWANIERRTGFRGEWRYGLLNDIRREEPHRLKMTVERFIALGLERASELPTPLPPPQLAVSPAESERAAAQFGLQAEESPLIALCPGAEYGPAKRWPPDHFATLAQALLQRGYRVVLLGSNKDRAAAEAIVRGVAQSGLLDLTGRTTLAQAIDLLALTKGVVSNDSGLMHIAAALAKPVVALYGSSDPHHTPPLAANARILRRELTCSPCYRRRCPLGHHRCMRELLPSQVLAALTTA